MKSFAERLTEDRRLQLLRTLAELPGYRSNANVLTTLMDSIGHAMSRAQINAQLQWLAEVFLVELTDIDGLLLVVLTPYGHDVARGLSSVPGVARPGA